jgi:SAM-dependent methyltransferase
MAAEPDRWSRWLLERRDAGMDRQREAALDHLAAVRDRVLDSAEPLEGATLLDVGAGDGLIGLRALERVGPEGCVIFADVSEALLARCEEDVRSLGLLQRARFMLGRAEELAGVADASVDVVTTRSVLIYVTRKERAFEAFARVLRPRGRLSLFEPINRLMFPEPADRFWGYEIGPAAELAARVKAEFVGEGSDRLAMTGFDDRDLLDLAVGAGFTRVHVECHLDVEPGSFMAPVSFDALLGAAPNPNAPTLQEAVTAILSESDQARFLAELRRAYNDGRAKRRMAGAYVLAHLD